MLRSVCRLRMPGKGFESHKLRDGDAQGLGEKAELGFWKIHLAGFDLGNGGAISIAHHSGQGILGKATLLTQKLYIFMGEHGAQRENSTLTTFPSTLTGVLLRS